MEHDNTQQLIHNIDAHLARLNALLWGFRPDNGETATQHAAKIISLAQDLYRRLQTGVKHTAEENF